MRKYVFVKNAEQKSNNQKKKGGLFKLMEILREQYEKEIIPAMMKKFNYKSVMQVPKLDKIVINIGLGDTKDNPKSLENAINDLTIITGQKPIITKAKKAIAAFKIREGINMGCKVT